MVKPSPPVKATPPGTTACGAFELTALTQSLPGCGSEQMIDKWLKNFLLLVCTLAVTSYLFISWAQSQMPLVQTEKLDTESMSEARQFQRQCFERNDAVLSVVIYEHAQAWRLTCQWEGQL